MAAAARTEFLNREFVGLTLFVFTGRVVAPLATVALKANQVSHLYLPVSFGLRVFDSGA
jgi:hypothetical protein